MPTPDISLRFSLLASVAFLLPAPLPVPTRLEGDDLSGELEIVRSETDAPGLVAIAIQDGEVVGWGAAGERAFGSQDPIQIEDPVHLGSCAKALTATLVGRLVDEKVFTWETTIAEAMPEFAKLIDEGFHDVTIEQLLQHRGGIAERRRPEVAAFQGTLQAMEGPANEVRREILAKVLALPPLMPEHGVHDYSNFGYMTVGLMIEVRTGKTWEEQLVEKVLKPMGLESGGIGSPTGEHVPVGHLREGAKWSPLPPGPGGFLPDAMGPAGLVHLSLGDWAKFVGEHLAGERGEDGFLTAASYKRLHADPGTGYAAGWGLTKLAWSWGEGTVITHNGSDNTWMSLVVAVPEWDITILTAANCAGSEGQLATDRAKELMMGALGLRD